MKFSNFKPLGSRFAEIDITTGMWWWKRTRTVGLSKIFDKWHFNNGGHWCPSEVRECEREYYRGKV